MLPFQILEIKTESQELIAALSTLSAIYQDNTPAARRHLRSTIEERGLGINEQFLEAAEGVTKVRGKVVLLLGCSSRDDCSSREGCSSRGVVMVRWQVLPDCSSRGSQPRCVGMCFSAAEQGSQQGVWAGAA